MKMGDFFSRPFSQENLAMWKKMLSILIVIIGIFFVYEYFEIKKEKIRIERERWKSDREWRDLQVKKLKMELEQWEWKKRQRGKR